MAVITKKAASPVMIQAVALAVALALASASFAEAVNMETLSKDDNRITLELHHSGKVATKGPK
ncbi:hypothetical protein ACP70R_018414 [Stipagrostis hirtigluma subsp. patula]